ncbi:PKD domain-containing protein [Maribacter sp. 2210JD10-5]|uniref:PKD domain-containing protein n=1 Tax=Maribacter sp. 2210JD10-5 TaxID=3386272 RepID=UPI0039BC4AC5
MKNTTLKLFFSILFYFCFFSGIAQVTNSLQNTDFETCGTDLPQAELNLGDLVLTESANTDFASGTYTFFIEAPSNFTINATTVTETGTDITAISVAQAGGNPSRLEVTVTTSAQTSLDVVTIENVRIQLIPSSTVTDGTLKYVLDGNANNINAFTDNQILATLNFTELSGGTGVNQEVCTVGDVQNISVTGANVTQSRTFEWQENQSGTWTSIPSSNTEILIIDNATFPNGVSRYRRITNFTVNGVACSLISTVATITVNEIYPGSITEGAGQNICTNTVPDQLGTASDVATTPGGTFDYQWYKNDMGVWEAITGATNNFYQPDALTTTTSYKRRITNNLNGFICFEETLPVTIVVNSPVAGGTATDQDICNITDLQLLIINSGESGTYQWQKNNLGTWENIAGATQGTYDASGNISPGVSEFRRVTTVTGASCEGISTVATITFTDFNEGTITGGETLCYNEVPSIITSSVDATGQGTVSYQWEAFDGVSWATIGGATTTSYQPMALTETTLFRRLDAVELNGFTCSEYTNQITVNVLQEINGGDASADQTICAADIPVNITVTNDTPAGPNITYQWQSATTGGFTNMVGETNSLLSFAVAPSETTRYRRQTTITDNATICADFSTESTVNVNTLTAGIIGNNQELCAGETPNTIITLSNATAVGNLTYTWEESTDNGASWNVIGGETGTTFTPGVLATTTRYRRLDTTTLNGNVCDAYTNEVIVNIAGAISGGTGSANQIVCENELPATITVTGATAAGVGITFQWYASADDITYNAIAGETGEELSFATGILTSTYFRREVIQNSGGNLCEANSTPTLITLISLSAGTISNTQTVCGTDTAAQITSAADAISNGTITYSWQDSSDGIAWSTIAGANQATFTPPVTADLETYYRRVASAELGGTTCTEETDAVILFVNRFDNPSTHQITFGNGGGTGSTIICNGGDPNALGTNFQLIASGDITYQWQESADNVNFNDISGATNRTFDPPPVVTDVYYRRISTSTLNGVICTLTSNVLEVVNGGDATAGSIGTTNGNAGAGTNEEVICENTDPSLIQELTAATGDGTLTYQWYANGIAITGATNIDYNPPAGLTQTTTYYRDAINTAISGEQCIVSSNSVVVRVPEADTIESDITICSGDTPQTLGDDNPIDGAAYISFQWEESSDGSTFVDIPGATTATYSPPSLTATRYYRRGYTSTVDAVSCLSGAEKFSNTVQIIINDVTGGTIQGNQDICFGDDPGLLDNVADGTASGVLSYQWYSSEVSASGPWSIIVDAVDNFYDPEAGSFPTTYFKRTTTSVLNGISCSEDSNTITVGVGEEILPGTLTNDQTVCEGDTPASLTVSGASTFADQNFAWLSSTDGIVWVDTGVTTASFNPPIPTQTILYKRTITRSYFGGTLDCEVETNPITITLNSVDAGRITDDQSVCQGSQPNPLIEDIAATGAGTLTYQWLSSPDDVVYSVVSGATQPNYTPPATLTTSTYFKREVTSSINGVNCTEDTAPKLITVIPYPIIDNNAIIANDIAPVSCFGGNDGSIVVPNGRITGGNSAQAQINTISFFGDPEFNNTYTVNINGIIYEHQITLTLPSNLPETNDELVVQLADEINTATGARLSDVIATTNANELILTAKVPGISFTVLVSTGSEPDVSASNVLTQANSVANTYEWTKIGDPGFTASTLSISNLTGGAYQLTVYNEFCGVTSEPFLVFEPQELVLTIGDTCDTAITANSTGGVAPFTFTLTRPDTTTLVQTSNNPSVTYTGLTAGATYTISVQDATCPIAQSQPVTLAAGLQFDEASVVVENVTCFGRNDGTISLNNGATTVTGGSAPYNFSWTGPNGASFSTENINNLAPGVYVLEVMDQLGCSATFTTNIASKSELSFANVQVINEQLQCAGDTNAEINIQISADGSSSLQIDWLRNGTSFATNSTSLANLRAGVYEVIVTDLNSDPGNPCSISQTITISEPEVFSATEIVTQDPECFDVAGTRTFTFSVTGGTQPYEYSVDGATAVTFTTMQATIPALSNDSHVITVTDANACVTETFLMDRFDPISYGGVRDFTLGTCEFDFDFSLDTSLLLGGSPFIDSDGQPYYLYDWTGPNGFIAQDIISFVAVPGTYSVVVTDSKGCTSESIDFTFGAAYEPLMVNRMITPVSCGADDDGAVTITVSGGNRPYTITWEQEVAGTSDNPSATYTQIGQNITQLTGLEEGRLRLTVTSNLPGCTEANPSYFHQEIITINKAESLQLVDGPFLDESLCAGGPGSIIIGIFNSQGGDLSFYYDGGLVPSVQTGTNTYSVQIGNPVESALLNVLNDQGCGFTTQLSASVVAPSFTYSSEEFDVSGLLLVREDIQFSNNSEGEYSYAEWDFGDGSPTVRVDPEIDGTVTTHNYDFPGVFTVTLTVFNEEGCSREIQQEVQIGNGFDIMFPSAFSANADGINDYFQGEYTGLTSFVFEIYDMWGALVFSASYNFENIPVNWGWDGNYSNGKPYKNTTFRYLFVGTTRENQQITKTGEATILR